MFELPTTANLLRRTFTVFGAGFVPFLLLALIIQWPVLAWKFLEDVLLSEHLILRDESLLTRKRQLVLGSILISVFFSAITSAVLVYGVFQHLRGDGKSIGKWCRLALSRLFPIIGLSILTSLAILGGLIFFIIPSFVIRCGLFVAAPVLMVEGGGVIRALRRSWALTDGYKWRILFVSLGLSVIDYIVGISLQKGAMLTGLVAVVTVGEFLRTGFITALHAVAKAVVYHDLRGIREGLMGEDELVAVFD